MRHMKLVLAAVPHAIIVGLLGFVVWSLWPTFLFVLVCVIIGSLFLLWARWGYDYMRDNL